MKKLNNEQLEAQRAMLFDDYTEYDKDYPTNGIKNVIAFFITIPTLVACWLLCR